MNNLDEQRSDRHLSDAGCFASDAELEQIVRINLVGLPGRNGKDGQSYFTAPHATGQNGRRGGDATAAIGGKDGGGLSVSLSYPHHQRHSHAILIHGRIRPSDEPERDYRFESNIGLDGYVFIQSPGGRGGNGGRGGDGQPGSTGRRGRNATRYSRGGNGGPGGNGGNAGNPTDGADSGAGGDVSLTVNEHHQGLLMLVKGHLGGGDIGFAGRGGRGGKGGQGGRGGSSHHWTETDHYTDSEGNRKTRVRSRSNPGGRNGRAGRRGASSSYRARDGRAGPPGRLQINVVHNDGSISIFPSPFDLELVGFDIASEYEILEPDSLVSVDRIVVRNRGGMPTPANYTVRVFIESDRWIESEQVDLVMHRQIAPGETFSFEYHGLRFRVGDYVVEAPRKRPFSAKHQVSPRASLESGIHRPFRQFETPDDVRFQFPIELAPIRSLRSLAPGESTRVIWGVTNRGSETFDHKHLCRAVRTKLGLLGGDIDASQLAFFDHEGQPHDLAETRFDLPIRDLEPGQTQTIETRIGVRSGGETIAYQGFFYGVDVDLQRPGSSDRSDEYRRVDYRKLFVRISERYRRDEGSRFLLIANQKTTAEDIDKWTQLADYFGSGLDVWDVSYYGFFDLVRAVDRDKSLLQQWRGMTIIVPNNYYQTPTGTTVAFEQLAKSQFIKAAADYDINFYVVGDSRTGGAAMLQASLVPVDDDKPASPLHKPQDFMRELKRWSKYVQRSHEVLGGDTRDASDLADASLGGRHELEIEKRTFLFQPDRKWLIARANSLQVQLRKSDPLHRWIVVHEYDTGDTDTSWGLFRKRKVGKLELRRTLDATKGSAVLYEVDGIDAIDRDFINSRANKHGIFLALKFEDKVDRFIRLVSERTFPRYSEKFIDRPLTDQEVEEIGGELVDSILVDLFNEQRVARCSKIWGRWHVRSLTPKLNYLAERALNYGLTYRQMQDHRVSLELLYSLIANVRYMAKRSMTIWDSAWFPTSMFKRSRAVSTHMLERSDQIVTNIFGRRRSWWDRVTSSNGDAFGSAKNKEPAGMARQAADDRLDALEAELCRLKPSVDAYAAAQGHEGLTYDPELWPAGSRVLSRDQFDALVSRETEASRRRQSTERSVREKRSDLLVPLERSQPSMISRPSVTKRR